MISGERKKFNLRSARKPMLVGGLSNTVVVYQDGQPYYCFIAFDSAFVSAVGANMPRGVSRDDPAFISVAFDIHAGQWIIASCYVADWASNPLWKSDQKPSWLKELKPIRHTNDNTNSTPAAQASTSRIVRAGNHRARARIAA